MEKDLIIFFWRYKILFGPFFEIIIKIYIKTTAAPETRRNRYFAVTAPFWANTTSKLMNAAISYTKYVAESEPKNAIKY